MLTQEFIRKVVEDVSEDEDFTRGPWVSEVVAICKSCAPNVLGDLTVTLKDLSYTISSTIHHKFLTEGGYGKAITIGLALILKHVSEFSPKQFGHYLSITMRSVVMVFPRIQYLELVVV
ncbi:hypothetical protein CTI12_AA264330 [Artemisia annua]|uniref:Homologous recombination OB-fold protein OB-fold domain-containing protein n=1 Tax=Artemisia annua TaxID=35608 RepID=A0A2U1NHZ3_ARTAN|nr:hypothetical protein CTI12_AA264330 [Artemisia annua]